MGIEIQCFYKGTPFPQSLILPDMDTFKEMKALWNECIIQGMRDGVSMPEQAKNYFEQMNKMVKWFVKWAKKQKDKMLNGSKCGKDFEKDFGMDLTHGQSIWYMDVYMLMKMGKIVDDEMNGWLMMTKGEDQPTSLNELAKYMSQTIKTDKEKTSMFCDHDPTAPEYKENGGETFRRVMTKK
jgi:oligoribonuclease NrnB/cAMP/cGMP phosphodiesterase (DHH superfamily)